MENFQNMLLTTLEEKYSNNVYLKGLIQVLSIGGFPVGSVIDSSLSTFLNTQKVKRLKVFFDKLNDGEIILEQTDIENNDFLHAYFSTVNYVVRTRTDEKVERFAQILKSLFSKEIDIDKFEDYNSILNELSEREFYILSKKLDYERRFPNNPESGLNEYQSLLLYWENFKHEIISHLNISDGEFNAILLRIQRTGCYSKFNGYIGENDEQKGYSTEIFRIIHDTIDKTGANTV